MDPIKLPKNILERVEEVRKEYVDREKALDEEYKIEEYLEAKKRLGQSYQVPINYMMEGFLANYDVPEGHRAILKEDSLHFEPIPKEDKGESEQAVESNGIEEAQIA